MTDLPVDLRKAPWKEKYIVEETPMLSYWMQFGTDPKDGTMDISNDRQDIFTGCTEDQVKKILAARNLFCDTLIEIINGPNSQFGTASGRTQSILPNYSNRPKRIP